MSNNEDLVERVDWEKIQPMSRYAGGHDDQMEGLLKNSTVLAHWNEGDYQGSVATCVQLNDTKEIVIFCDYYGSCSGCDAWEDASDEEALRMCKGLAAGAKIFKNIEECKEFLSLEKYESNDYEWDCCSKELLEELENGEKDD